MIILKKKKLIAAAVATAVFAGNFAVMPQLAGMQSYTVKAVCDTFDANYDGWHHTEEEEILAPADGMNGTRGLLVTGRDSSAEGAASSKGFYLIGGEKYRYSINVKADTAEKFHLSLTYLDDETHEEKTVELDSANAKAGEWTELSAEFKAPKGSYEFEMKVTTDSTADFIIDECVVTGKETAAVKAAGNGLKEAFAGYGFRVGNILNGYTVGNSGITTNYIKDFNAIECENETKADAVLVQNGSTDTNVNVSLNRCASILDFCVKNNMGFRGHAFVWHSQTPTWFFKEGFNANAGWVSPSVMNQRLESYIKNTFNAFATQYPNLDLYAYDVVNEAVSDDSNRTANNGGARLPGDNNVEGGKSGYVAVYGDNSFIETAFTYARKYAPASCKLYYNDYNEYWDHKRDCIINTILKPLKAKNLIDGMGMQSHVPANATGFAGTDSYLQAMDMYLALGIDVQVTELDISLENGKYSLQDQANKYKAIFQHAMEVNTSGKYNGRVTLIQVWGPNDANSWLSAGSNALLYDSNNQPKVAYTTLMNLGDGNGPIEGTDGGTVELKPNDFGWWYQCGFEDGTSSWTDRGGNTVAQSSAEHYTEYGNNSLYVSGRTETWQGAIYTLDSRVFKAGEAYSFSAHVKQNSGENVKFMMKIEYTDASGETAYDEVANVIAPDGKWAQLVNTSYTIPADASGIKIYIETETSLTDFYIDEAIGAVDKTGIAGEGQPDIPRDPSTIILGDTDFSGTLTALDMVFERKAVIGDVTDTSILKAADVDQSGGVEINDLVLLQEFLLGMIDEFPNNRPPVDTAAMEAIFKGVSINSSWKDEGENNVLWTHRFGADPGFMVYKDRLYVYTTNDAPEYRSDGKIQVNTYNSGTINCFSTADMVNWTDHGPIPVAGRNGRTQNGAAKWATYAWAPDAAWKTINGKDKFFLYFADSAGGIGVLTADSPEGPYTDPIGKALINKSTSGFGDVEWLFDPAVLVDDDGTGYLYVGGGVPSGKAADPGTARAIKLGNDMTSLSGSAVRMNPPYLFEDSSIIKVGDTYYYSYCTNWNTGGNPYGFGNAEIGVMTSTNPLGPFTYKGIAFKNPASFKLDGGGNNHHSIVEFKGKYYMLYHSRNLSREMNIQALNSDGTVDLGGNYRSPHADVCTFSNGMFTATGTMKGVTQVETLNPYTTVQAETMSNQSKGITTNGLYDTKVIGKKGEWTKVSGVNFKNGTDSLTIKASSSDGAAVKVCVGSPTGEVIGYAELSSTMENVTVPTVSSISGTKDVYFVFSGNVEFDSWSVK